MVPASKAEIAVDIRHYRRANQEASDETVIRHFTRLALWGWFGEVLDREHIEAAFTLAKEAP
jgi:hypothetical protein